MILTQEQLNMGFPQMANRYMLGMADLLNDQTDEYGIRTATEENFKDFPNPKAEYEEYLKYRDELRAYYERGGV